MDHPDRIESWRPFPGWEGWYDVSDKGRFRSLDRVVCGRWGPERRKGRILAQSGVRYRKVGLHRNGETVSVNVHSAVLLAFAGPPGPGQEARHGALGSLVNWWPENLCYGTPGENNTADKIRDGHQVKLTDAIVLDCRRRKAVGERAADLAAEYGVSKWTMYDAISGKTWGWLADDDAVAGQ